MMKLEASLYYATNNVHIGHVVRLYILPKLLRKFLKKVYFTKKKLYILPKRNNTFLSRSYTFYQNYEENKKKMIEKLLA